jgi:serine protease Do
MKLIFSCLLILSWPGTEKLRAIETSPAKKPNHEVFEKRVPESPDDLIAIEEQVRSVLKNSKAATVCVQGNGSGSGVIISEDGLVLTAGHVSGEPGKKIHVVLQDGTKLKAKALGRSAAADSGLIRITEKGKYPFVDVALPATVFKGDWIFAIGHPGGFDKDRGLVLRVGRVIHRSTDTIQTDCKLIGGDSGGPLFDMLGRVVGIHSRVSKTNEQNFHVTVRAFKRDWDRMLASKIVTIDDSYAKIDRKGGFLGIQRVSHPKGVLITGVIGNSPAAVAKLRPGDIITHIDEEKIESLNLFRFLINQHGPGEKVTLKMIKRWEGGDDKVVVTLGDRNKFIPPKKVQVPPEG